MKILRVTLLAFIFCLIPMTIYGFGVYDLKVNNEVEVISSDVLDDLSESANKEAFSYLIEKKALLLREEGVMEISSITREDYVTMFCRLMTGYRFHEVSESPYYIDVNVRDWYAGYVEWARYNGVAKGFGNDVWGIGYDLTVEQMCQMAYTYTHFNEFEIKDTEFVSVVCKDYDNVSHWAKDGVMWCLKNGLISVDSSGCLNPLSSVSWNTAVSFLERFDNRLIKE